MGQETRLNPGAEYATIPGGTLNSVSASYGFAAGRRAKANHEGSFVWGDSTDADIITSGNNQFIVRAAGGVGINNNNPASALDVNGTVTADGFAGPGGGLTALNAANLASGAVPDARLSANVALRAGGNAFTGQQTVTGGNMGIGTGSPLRTLHVQDNAGNQGNIQVGANFSGSEPKLIHFGDRQVSGLGYVYIGEQGMDDTLELRAARFYFNNGYVGIGGYPQQRLDVRGTIRAQALEGQPTQPLEVFVDGQRALRLEPTAIDSGHAGIVNVVAGSAANFVQSGVRGATISGGGATTLDSIDAVQSVRADFATIGGGMGNRVSAGALYSVIGGGGQNTNGGQYASIGGGRLNAANSQYASIGGGGENTAGGTSATVSGGYGNLAAGQDATVGGGSLNQATNLYSTVGGGRENLSLGDSATVPGGYHNEARHDYATVGGGWQNSALGYTATISGGAGNTASDNWATVGGGWGNSASGRSSIIPGGYNNEASGGTLLPLDAGPRPHIKGPSCGLIPATLILTLLRKRARKALTTRSTSGQRGAFTS